MYHVNIITEDGKISRLFFVLNDRLILKYQQVFKKIKDSSKKIEILENLWKKEYFANIVKKENIWYSMVFDREEDFTNILLKYN